MSKEFMFKHFPTPQEIKKCVEEHNKYTDYVQIWYDDNTKEIFYNTVPQITCVLDKYGHFVYKVVFVNSFLSKPGTFGKLGIIRSKRICIKKQELI